MEACGNYKQTTKEADRDVPSDRRKLWELTGSQD